MIVVKRLSKPIMGITQADGLGIGINNFEAAGQVVNHLHVHMIPRFDKDGYKSWERTKLTPNREITEIQKKLVERLSSYKGRR